MPGGTEHRVIRVLIADDVVRVVQDLAALSEQAPDIEVCGVAPRAADIAGEAASLAPDVLLLREQFDGSDPSRVALELAATSPLTRVVTIPIDGTDSIQQRIAAIRGAAARSEPTIELAARPQRRAGSTGSLVVLLPASGGAGTSALAIILSATLSRVTDKTVALVDLDLLHGDVRQTLHLEHHPTAIDDLMQRDEEPDRELLEQVCATGPANVAVLLAPHRPEHAELVTEARLRTLLIALRRNYGIVVAYVPSRLDERGSAALDDADLVIVVGGPNSGNLADVELTRESLTARGLPVARVATVVATDADDDYAESMGGLAHAVATLQPGPLPPIAQPQVAPPLPPPPRRRLGFGRR
ncbi:MAG: hypothetical protein JOZ92_04800 [Candidatus Dormibacteraeota bacterium]|nr:hypothetical protein [Candidatus Dormibacteraeota bacterium]